MRLFPELVYDYSQTGSERYLTKLFEKIRESLAYIKNNI